MPQEWSQLIALPNSLDAYRITLEEMRKFVLKDYLDLRIRRLAEQILDDAHVPGHNHRAEAAELLRWVQTHITYRPDPVHVELVKDPIRVLQTRAGDCDDLVTLLAALDATIGLLPRFYAPSSNGREPDHASLEVFIDGEWITQEPTNPNAQLGWRVRSPFPDYVYPIFDDGGGSMPLGAYDQYGNYYTPPSDGGIDWGQEIDTGLRTLPSILYAARGVPNYGGGFPGQYGGNFPGGTIGGQASYNLGNQSAGFGLNLTPTTILLIGLGLFLLLRKK